MLFFFSSRRRHTRWPRDWSSDVCSSDLTITTSTLSNFSAIMYLLNNYIIADNLSNSLVQAFEIRLIQLNQYNLLLRQGILSFSILPYSYCHHIVDQNMLLLSSFFLIN